MDKKDYKLAYDYILNLLELGGDMKWPLTIDSMNIFKELVDKAIPKKPIRHLNSFYRCKNCDELFQNHHYQKHCPNCGQKLDWREKMRKLRVSDLFPLFYPNQKVRIINYIKDIDTGVCTQYDDEVIKYIHHNVNKISITGDVIRIEVEIND